jgi:uncharacterized protein
VRLIVEISHPAHVHLFRHLISEMEQRGHQTLVVTREKDVTLRLLVDYHLPHINISRQGRGLVGLLLEMLIRDWRLLRLARHFEPDLFIGLSMCSAHVAALTQKKSVILDDTEHARLERMAWRPWATVICTPEAYLLDLGSHHQRYAGYHELAYLHPNHFTPDSTILKKMGLSTSEPYFLVRFVSWQATHDVRQHGFSYAGKDELVRQLARRGRVIVTSEVALPPEFEPYGLNVSPKEIHHLLNFSRLYIGEGATMASEAVMLGVPSIYVNSLTAGTLQEQEKKYGLLHWVTDEQKAIDLAVEMADDPDRRPLHQAKRARLLADKLDVTAWLVRLLERLAPAGRSG